MNWDYDELDRYAKKTIDKAIRNLDILGKDDYERIRKELHKAGVEGLARNNKTYDFIKLWLKHQGANVNLRKQLYDPKDGLITNFSEAGQNIKNLYRGNKINKIRRDIEVEALGLTALATNNKDDLAGQIANLQSHDNQINPPFNEKDKQLLAKLSSLLKVKTTAKTSTPKAVTEVIDSTKKALSTFEPISTSEREAYYDYWDSVSGKFTRFARTMFGLSDALKELEGFEDNPTMQELKTRLKRVKIPNYVIRMPPIELEQMEEAHLARKLIMKFIKLTPGVSVPDSWDIYDEGGESTGSSISPDAILDAEKPQTVQERASVDLEEDHEVKVRQEEQLARIKKEKQPVDILFALSAKQQDSKVTAVYSDAVIARAKEELKETSRERAKSQGWVKQFDEWKHLLDEPMDNFFDKYKLAQNVAAKGEEKAAIHIIDDTSNMITIERLYKNRDKTARFEVEYLTAEKPGEVQRFNASSYEEATEFINENTRKFFKIYGEVIGLVTSYDPITGTKSKPTPPGVRGMQEQWYGGGKTGERRGQLPSVTPPKEGPTQEGRPTFSRDTMKDLQLAGEHIIEYYVEPLQSRWVLDNDRPLFYSDSHLVDIQMLIAKDPVTLALLDMMDPKSQDPDIIERDIGHLIVALKDLDKGTTVRLNENTINKWSRFTSALMNLFAGVSRDKDVMKKLRRNIRSKVGSILYEIGKHSLSEKGLESKRWPSGAGGKLLSEWDRISEEEGAQLPNILGLITHGKFESMVKRKQNKKLDKALKSLKRAIRTNNSIKLASLTGAMLEAKDLLLKSKGEQIYRAYLDLYDPEDIEYVSDIIQKENKIDLYAKDIELIVKHEGSFNTVAENMGLNEDIIYKVKGLFR
tara:strand:+ start:6394 stop:8991 length:2598 start_codon:yes stop_codon:yes gene_type:complete